MSRPLFLLYTCRKNLAKAEACLRTWAKKEKDLLIITDEALPVPARQEIIASHGYQHLCEKTCLMWETIATKHLGDYGHFVKVDDDTFVFTNNLKRRLHESTADFFGNWQRWRSPEPGIIKWVTGSFYGLSAKSVEVLAEQLKKPSERAEFIGRGPAEDVSVSAILAKKQIAPAAWPGMFVQEHRQTLRSLMFRPREPISVTNLTPTQMRLVYGLAQIRQGGWVRPFFR